MWCDLLLIVRSIRACVAPVADLQLAQLITVHAEVFRLTGEIRHAGAFCAAALRLPGVVVRHGLIAAWCSPLRSGPDLPVVHIRFELGRGVDTRGGVEGGERRDSHQDGSGDGTEEDG